MVLAAARFKGLNATHLVGFGAGVPIDHGIYLHVGLPVSDGMGYALLIALPSQENHHPKLV